MSYTVPNNDKIVIKTIPSWYQWGAEVLGRSVSTRLVRGFSSDPRCMIVHLKSFVVC